MNITASESKVKNRLILCSANLVGIVLFALLLLKAPAYFAIVFWVFYNIIYSTTACLIFKNNRFAANLKFVIVLICSIIFLIASFLISAFYSNDIFVDWFRAGIIASAFCLVAFVAADWCLSVFISILATKIRKIYQKAAR